MKKILGVLGIVAIAVAMFFSANINGSSSDSDTSLVNLLTLNSANAECFNRIPELNHGGCSFTGNCYWGAPGNPCDPTANW